MLLAPVAAGDASRGIDLFSKGDEAGARRVFLKVIATNPDGVEAASAHMYLGLMALNALDAKTCRKEFLAALTLDALLELPFDAPPKATVFFRQARATVTSAAPPPPAADPIRRPEPSAGTQLPAPPPFLAEPQPKNERPLAPSLVDTREAAPAAVMDPVPALWVGGAAVLALGTALVFGSLQSQTVSNAKNDAASLPAANALSQAKTDGVVADACFIGAGALAIAGAILLFTQHRSGVPESAVGSSGAAGSVAASSL